MLDLLLITGIIKPSSTTSLNYLYPFTYSVPVASIYETLKEKYAIKVFIPEIIGKNYLEMLPESRVYGFSISYFEMPEARNIVEYIRIKYPDSKIVFGGQYSTVFYQDVFKYASPDYVVRGNGVFAIDNILSGKHYANVCTPNSPCENIFDRNEVVSSSILDKDAYVGISWGAVESNPLCYQNERWVVTNHGCPYDCSYCTNKTHSNQRIIYRSIDNIIKEIDYYSKQDDELLISLTEPEFNIKSKQYREYVFTLLNRIYHETSFSKKNTLSFFVRISDVDDEFIEMIRKFKNKISYDFVVGVESFNNDVLANMNRRDTKERMFDFFNRVKDLPFVRQVSGSLIFGTPKYSDAVFQENVEETQKLYSMYKNSPVILELSASPLYLIPGSRYYEERGLHKDLYIQDGDIDKQIQLLKVDEDVVMNAGLKEDWFIKAYRHRVEYQNEIGKMV